MYGVAGKFAVDLMIDGISYPVDKGRLFSLRMHEMSNHVASTAEVALEDSGNWLMEVMPFTGTEIVSIGLGGSLDDIIYHNYRIYNAHASRFGSGSHHINLYLVSAGAAGMFQPARYRSYPNMTASDVVRSIADELDLSIDEQSFEETDLTHNFFCPGWTFAQFMGWLANRARSKQHGTAGFMYFVDLEDKIHFCSPEFVKVQEPILHIVPKEPDPDRYSDDDIPQGTHRVHYNPLLLGGQGAYGVNRCHWDFSTGKFTENPLTVNGETGAIRGAVNSGFSNHGREALASTTMKGISDNIGVLKSSLDPDTIIMNGGVVSPDIVTVGGSEVRRESSLIYNKNTAEAKLLKATNSLSKLETLIEGDIRVRAGKIVDLHIKSVFPQQLVNQTLSGKYVVEKVTHQIVPSYWTKLIGYRSGVSGSDEVELVEPPIRIR